MSLIINQNYITRNRPYRKLVPQGIALHSTDPYPPKDDTASANREYFNTGDRGGSAHAFVDDVGVVETIPDNEVSWGAGSPANDMYINIEICYTVNSVRFAKIYENAVEYFAQKMIKFGFNTVSKLNLRSHAEISAQWKDTNHTDPTGYFKKYGKTVDGFRSDVQSRINLKTAHVKTRAELANDLVWEFEDGGGKTPRNIIDSSVPASVKAWVLKATTDDGLYALMTKTLAYMRSKNV